MIDNGEIDSRILNIKISTVKTTNFKISIINSITNINEYYKNLTSLALLNGSQGVDYLSMKNVTSL